jgi:signal transduction histidine kinase
MPRGRSGSGGGAPAALLDRRPDATRPDGGRRLLSQLAHEVRAPLAAIKSYAEILLTSPPVDPDERREFLRAILEESDRVRQLLDDLNEIDKLEAGAHAFVPAPVDLGEVVERALLALHPLAAAKRVDLAAEPADQPALVGGEPQRLLRAVLALVENAVKFSRIGGRVRVRLVTWSDDRTLSLEVADEGIGVPAAAAGRIFDRFFQASVPPDNLSPRGSGLGLTLVRLVAERHRGSIAYQPRPAGSVFTLRLPLLPPPRGQGAAGSW